MNIIELVQTLLTENKDIENLKIQLRNRYGISCNTILRDVVKNRTIANILGFSSKDVKNMILFLKCQRGFKKQPSLANMQSRGTLLLIHPKTQNINIVSYKLLQGFELATSSCQNTEDIQDGKLDKMPNSVQEICKEFGSDDPDSKIMFNLTSKLDGSMFCTSLLTNELCKIMKPIIKQYGSPLAKTFMEMSLSISDHKYILLPSTKGSSWVDEITAPRIITSILCSSLYLERRKLENDIRENGITPEKAMKKYGEKFIEQCLFFCKEHKTSTLTFEAINANLQDAWSSVNSPENFQTELVEKKSFDALVFLGTTSQFDFIPSHEFKTCNWKRPLHWYVTIPKALEMLFDLDECIMQNSLHTFLEKHPEISSNNNIEMLSAEGFMFGQNKLKTRFYYEIHNATYSPTIIEYMQKLYTNGCDLNPKISLIAKFSDEIDEIIDNIVVKCKEYIKNILTETNIDEKDIANAYRSCIFDYDNMTAFHNIFKNLTGFPFSSRLCAAVLKDLNIWDLSKQNKRQPALDCFLQQIFVIRCTDERLPINKSKGNIKCNNINAQLLIHYLQEQDQDYIKTILNRMPYSKKIPETPQGVINAINQPKNKKRIFDTLIPYFPGTKDIVLPKASVLGTILFGDDKSTDDDVAVIVSKEDFYKNYEVREEDTRANMKYPQSDYVIISIILFILLCVLIVQEHSITYIVFAILMIVFMRYCDNMTNNKIKELDIVKIWITDNLQIGDVSKGSIKFLTNIISNTAHLHHQTFFGQIVIQHLKKENYQMRTIDMVRGIVKYILDNAEPLIGQEEYKEIRSAKMKVYNNQVGDNVIAKIKFIETHIVPILNINPENEDWRDMWKTIAVKTIQLWEIYNNKQVQYTKELMGNDLKKYTGCDLIPLLFRQYSRTKSTVNASITVNNLLVTLIPILRNVEYLKPIKIHVLEEIKNPYRLSNTTDKLYSIISNHPFGIPPDELSDLAEEWEKSYRDLDAKGLDGKFLETPEEIPEDIPQKYSERLFSTNELNPGTKPWKENLAFYGCGRNNGVAILPSDILFEDELKERWHLLRGKFVESIVCGQDEKIWLNIVQSKIPNVKSCQPFAVGLVVIKKYVKNSPGAAPDLLLLVTLLDGTMFIMPVEIKSLKGLPINRGERNDYDQCGKITNQILQQFGIKKTDSSDRKREIQLASMQLEGCNKALGQNNRLGVMVLVWTYYNIDMDLVHEAEYYLEDFTKGLLV